jgi:hypothetical protein
VRGDEPLVLSGVRHAVQSNEGGKGQWIPGISPASPDSAPARSQVEEDDPREKLREHCGRPDPFLREDLPSVESRTWCRTVSSSRPRTSPGAGTSKTERPDHEGLFPDRGRSDEESGRPIQLGGKRHQKQEPTTEGARTRLSHDAGVHHSL